ncbi:uncharacterized protein LOC131937517 [Physella acuta]|uniref:uncharacterized protein LOC131937517 n=1 Tax=Physella acuta TaxID=109671 RepID=UPI0027DCEE73|nr:uncharacterized protein LOC131937517 [Physella acuta]
MNHLNVEPSTTGSIPNIVSLKNKKMRAVRCKGSLIVLACCVSLYAIYLHITRYSNHSNDFKLMEIDTNQNNAIVNTRSVTVEIPDPERSGSQIIEHTISERHQRVNLVPSVPPSDFVLPVEDCLPLPKSPRENVKICLFKDDSDIWVSGNLKKGKLWEEDLVLELDKALKNDPDLMLVDLGANLGEYTLWAAALGYRVLAVEMVLENVHMLQTSLMLSGLSQLVTIVNNALYSDHRTLQVNFMAKNMGGSRLNTSNVFEPLDNTRGVVLVNTICLDDLIPLVSNTSVYMKLDIENTEHEALKCADHFFSKVNVKVVQMECLNKTPEEINIVIRFMDRHGYVMSKSGNKIVHVSSCSGDVFFLKNSFFLNSSLNKTRTFGVVEQTSQQFTQTEMLKPKQLFLISPVCLKNKEMRAVRCKGLVIVLACCVTLCALYLHISRYSNHSNDFKLMEIDTNQNNAIVNTRSVTVEIPAPERNGSQTIEHKISERHQRVNLVPSVPPFDFVLPVEDCLPLPKSPRENVKICLYKQDKDVWLSESLKKNKLWEEDLVLELDKALKNDPDLMLVDLGANLGEYTLWAAALGHRALAVEMVLENVRMLQTSLMLSGLSQLVTIVNNALYSDHRTLQVNFMAQNMGGSRLNTSNVFEPLDNTRGVVLVNTICLDDLIPLVSNTTVYMKLDIENTEHEALKCADLFFSKVNVKVVQMECLNKTSKEMIIAREFMDRHGYVMSQSGNQIVPVFSCSGDAFFLKKVFF